MATTGGRRPTGILRRSGAPDQAKGGQGLFDLLKKFAVPIIGGVTPVMLIVINAAVWINDHVQSLALWVAIAAFISGMMFNTWIGLSLYRWVQRRWPHWSPVAEQNQEVMLVLGMGLITVVTFLTSLGLYLSLHDAKGLPNAWTLWYGIIQIVYPFLLKVYVDRDKRGKGGGEKVVSGNPPRGVGAEPQGSRSGSYVWQTSRPIGPPPPQGPPPGGGYLPPS